ncbi:Nucleolar protein 12 [Coemansia sp. RSA 2711]|nr:Nucleolar protein 12 [Coemansia sp. RSA 2711]KAJ2313385.1 Nucleolar protein 12 [Coemansia sp. RSA 2705]
MANVKKGEISQLLAGGSKKGASIDSALDSLFANAPPPASVPTPTKQTTSQPALNESGENSQEQDTAPKNSAKKKKAKKEKASQPKAVDTDAKPTTSKPAEPSAAQDKDAAAKQARRKRHGIDDSDDEMEIDETAPPAKKEKKSLLGRMPQDAEALKRTLFIGNLTIQCITDRKVYSELKTLCSSHGTIKAIRFRSIAFSELLPRKIAFIRGKFHSERQVCNAYVEYADEDSAKKALVLNGTQFQEKHIRADLANNDKAHDMKRSVFVGNLDFAAEEEDLWRHFGSCGAVENVRIIRDSKTNLGKGFAYVQFVDRSSVALALKLNGAEVNSRKLRVQRGSEKAIKEKQRTVTTPDSITRALEGTRSVKGDKPSNKKRRTARSRSFAEKRLNTASDSRKPARTPARGAPRGRGKPKARA